MVPNRSNINCGNLASLLSSSEFRPGCHATSSQKEDVGRNDNWWGENANRLHMRLAASGLDSLNCSIQSRPLGRNLLGEVLMNMRYPKTFKPVEKVYFPEIKSTLAKGTVALYR